MSPRHRYVDDRQLGLEFERQVDQAIVTMAQMAVATAAPTETEPDDLRINVDELYVELALECKRAIREAGMNVEQLAQSINQMCIFGEGETTANPVSVAVLRNYLSKPTTNRLPIWVGLVICLVANSHGPYDAQLRRLGHGVIDSREQLRLMLGLLDDKFREIGAAKRKVEKQIRLIKGRTDVDRIINE